MYMLAASFSNGDERVWRYKNLASALIARNELLQLTTVECLVLTKVLDLYFKEGDGHDDAGRGREANAKTVGGGEAT